MRENELGTTKLDDVRGVDLSVRFDLNVLLTFALLGRVGCTVQEREILEVRWYTCFIISA